MMVRQGPSVRSFAAAGICLGLGVLSLCGGCAGVSDKDIKNVSALEVRRMVETSKKKGNDTLVVLVDPRSPPEFARERLPGARNVRLVDVPPDARVDSGLDRYDNIVVYGANAASPPARAMTKRLLAVGYSDVRFMVGGLEEWLEIGGEVESDR